MATYRLSFVIEVDDDEDTEETAAELESEALDAVMCVAGVTDATHEITSDRHG